MGASARFTVALHVLTLLAARRREALTSEFIAGSVNTNPVVIRRVLGLLREAGLAASQPGAHGGWKLRRDPARITLLDVRRAVEEPPPFAMHARAPNPACPVGRNIQKALGRIYGEAEKAMELQLARTTIESLERRVRKRGVR
mgnify:CR=1 FL=1